MRFLRRRRKLKLRDEYREELELEAARTEEARKELEKAQTRWDEVHRLSNRLRRIQECDNLAEAVWYALKGKP